MMRDELDPGLVREKHCVCVCMGTNEEVTVRQSRIVASNVHPRTCSCVFLKGPLHFENVLAATTTTSTAVAV